jgi:CRISPR-associated protein Csb2
LPPRLSDALAVDTGAWHEAGWSSPPPLYSVVYDRPAVGPLPARGHPRGPARAGQPGTPEAARFVLAGRPCPRVEETLRIAEIARRALMSIGDTEVPVELCGRDENGALRDDPSHRHAFYLPEDADQDGLIDHLVVYCRLGFSPEARHRLDRLTRIWIEHGRADEEGERGRKEWRVALEDIAVPAAFADSRLLGPSRIWKSATPYLKPRLDRRRPRSFEEAVGTYRKQLTVEWARRFPGTAAPDVEPLLDAGNRVRFAAPVGPGRALRSALAFARTRRGGRGGQQPDASGGFFRLRFSAAVEGPIALGYGAHFGLGLFRRAEDEGA